MHLSMQVLLAQAFPSPHRTMHKFLLPALLLASTFGCQSAYYATMEKFGVAKREILVDRVAAARADQAEAKVQIQTTYEAFQAIIGFDGGDLEDKYKTLKNEYEDAEDAAEDVTNRIDKIEHVAGSMFTDWDDEIAGMEDASLRNQSKTMRRDTETRYYEVVRVMRGAESKMKPVLKSFEDHVTFLKHHLNAQAISGLKDSALSIQGDVDSLIESMQASIDEADAFLKDMGQES